MAIAAELAPRLAAALARHALRPGRIEALSRLTGGATKETWSFDWVGAQGRLPLIVQLVPEPAVRHGAGATGREKRAPRLSAGEDAALMTLARAHGVPAPEVHAVLDASDGLGQGYVTGRVDGQTLGRKVVGDPSLAEARSTMAAQAGRILATVHRLPTDGAPFLQRLSPSEEIAVYTRLLDETGLRHPAIEYALQWARRHVPATWTDGVVHADFRTGNLVVGRDGIGCVLDWEIARIGDPMQDLGVLCMHTWRFGGAGEVGGFGDRADLYAAYEDAGGEAVDPARVRFWEALSNLKWAIGCARRGLTPAGDGRPARLELAAVGRRLEEPLWDFFALLDEAA